MTLRAPIGSLLLLTLLAAPAGAQTQGNFPRFQDHASDPSEKELHYAEGLAEVLGRPVSEVCRVQLAYTLGQFPPVHGLRGVPPTATRKSRGLRLNVGGLGVWRTRFSTPGEAYAYCAFQGPTNVPLLVEARGKQVVILKGAPLRSPRLLARLRAAAWATLRHDPGVQTTLAFYLGETQWVFDSGAKNLALPSPIEDCIDRLLTPGLPSYTGWLTLATSSKRHHGFATRDRETGLRRVWISPVGADSTNLVACFKVLTEGSLALTRAAR
jgi:hypothetical protein